MRILKAIWSATWALVLCTALAACSNSGAQRDAAVSQSSPPPTTQSHNGKQTTSEQPLPAESNPPGDIPDTQRFVDHVVSGTYSIAVPEGWAQSTDRGATIFSDKFDGEQISVTKASAPPAASPGSPPVAALRVSGKAVLNLQVKSVTLPAGSAVEVTYTSNSETDPVTGKRVRLNNQAYLFYKGNRLATLRLWAPLGTDNVDQWRHIAQSFKWL